ncbi:SRPBCC domain-containing protein [Prevotella sp. 10(H)]|uniref:SRPBCC family protein n=1 Tax=Prevotella sp. 10(H) TaxID=1158294 RepID=UPI0004A73543|nr:SRPBCC domain-containing protein [Prevotella sp. 10(H)]
MNNTPIIIKKTYPVPVSKVWAAITDKDKMREWYFDIDDFTLHKGSEFNFSVTFDGRTYHHRCTIIEIEPEKKLVYTWTHPEDSEGESVVEWEMESVPEGTEVTLTHFGTENFADAGEGFSREDHEQGWEEILGENLKDYLAR